MDKNQPLELKRESLLQLSQGQLVDMVIEQAKSIQKLTEVITELEVEVQKLKVGRNLDSKTSSKPPSGDILKKSEKKQDPDNQKEAPPKRKPGGQPGHPGKTRCMFW
jgi:transposase